MDPPSDAENVAASPDVHRLYEERQEAFAAGQRWTSIAVLIAGQARWRDDGVRDMEALAIVTYGVSIYLSIYIYIYIQDII